MQLQELFSLPDSFYLPNDITEVPPALLLAFAGALLARMVPPLVARAVIAATRVQHKAELSEPRSTTIHRFVTDMTRIAVIALFGILILALFVDTSGLLTFLGLFTAAFGLAVRPLVSDYISGLIFLLEDQYDIGDEIEVASMKGTVLELSIRTTALVSATGELYRIPNGDIRIVRNFTRGDFVLISVQIAVPNSDLDRTTRILDELAEEVCQQVPALLETPEILMEDGTLGDTILVTLFAKARYGEAPRSKRRLLEIARESLFEHDVMVKQ